MARKLHRSKEVIFSAQGHMLANESAAIEAREIYAFLDHDQGPKAIAARADDKGRASRQVF